MRNAARLLVGLALCVAAVVAPQSSAHASCTEPLDGVHTGCIERPLCDAASRFLGWMCID